MAVSPLRIVLPLVVVREWTAADAEPLARHANSAAVARQLRDRFPHPYDRAQADRFLEFAAGQDPCTVWALEVNGEAAGGIGIQLGTDVERVSAEIGYWLGEAHWGRGIVSGALAAVTAEAFRRFDITRLFALPFADNAGSVRVLEKAGYVREGHFRNSAIKDGRLRDQFVYAAYRPPS